MASKKSVTSAPIHPSHRRPLLAGGERLREHADRYRVPGDFVHPYTVSQLQDLLRPQAKQLLSDVTSMPGEMAGRHMVIEAAMSPNYLAASHFPHHLLQAAELYPVGTKQSRGTLKRRTGEKDDVPTKTMLLAGSAENLVAFAEMAASELSSLEEKVLNDIRGISSICIPQPGAIVTLPEIVAEGEVVTWEAVITTIGRNEHEWKLWGDEAFEKWVAYVRRLSGDVDVKYRRTVGGVTFVPIALEVGQIHNAARFNLLRSIRPMPRMRQFPVCSKSSIMSLMPGPNPLPATVRPKSDIRVALFDGGLDASSPYFAPFVELHNLTSEMPTDDNLRHGSMVTSSLLYGHVTHGRPLEIPECYVDHYRVMPLPPQQTFDDELCWFLDQIASVLRDGKHKYVVLAVGPNECVDDTGEPHRWTSTLDTLANEFDVVFAIAAGNNGAEDSEKGYDRILVPADMANGVGVGAHGTRQQKTRVQRADYSPVGPGRPGQRVQPVGVGFGGCKDDPFFGFDSRSQLSDSFGTSFAAPAAMRGMVGLAGGLGVRSASATVRAFAAHCAEGGSIKGKRLTEVGHGRLRESYALVWECPPNEVTVLYQDSLPRAQTTAMRLPMPAIGIEPGVEIEIVWTLCYSSAVDPADTADYTHSGYEVTFRPHDRKRKLCDVNKEEVQEIDTLRDAAFVQNYLATQGGSISSNPVSFGGWGRGRHESEQRAAGKWETLSRGRVTLAAEELCMPRLDLTHVARSNGVLVRDVPDLHTTLLVTIRAPQEVALYDLARAQFGVLIPLEQHTHVSGDPRGGG